MNLLVVMAGLVGLCLGSYATTAGLRLAQGEQSLRGRSRCDHCAAPLNFAQTVPILAFVRQCGQCQACKSPIDRLHLVGEVSGAAILALSFWAAAPLRAALLSGLGLVLLAIAMVDAKSRRLPDGLTIALAVLCGLLAAQESVARLVEGVAASALAFVVLEALRRGYLRFRGKAGLGFGDVKLVAALALWLGLATPWVLALAAMAGLMVMAVLRPRDGRMAFGPAIACAGWSIGFVREAHIWPGLF